MKQLPLPYGDTPMDTYTAIGIAEGFIACNTEGEYIAAWQHLIDTGLCWQLQGKFGRTAQAMIANGHCTEAK